MTAIAQGKKIVYVLHFHRPIGGKSHYIGITAAANAAKRWDAHRRCAGAKLTGRAAEAGIGFTVARIYRNADHGLERRLKRRGHAEKLCPICRGELDLDGEGGRYEAMPPAPWDETDNAVQFPPATGPARSSLP